MRVQARIRARRVRMSTEGQAVQKLLEARRTQMDILREAEVSIAFSFSSSCAKQGLQDDSGLVLKRIR